MNRRAVLATALASAAAAAHAHPGHTEFVPLLPEDVERVVSVLTSLGSEAAKAGWQPSEGQTRSLIVSVYVFAAGSNRARELPAFTNRVLVTYDALSRGVLNADGSYVIETDSLTWNDYLFPLDAAIVVKFRDRLDALSAVFLGG